MEVMLLDTNVVSILFKQDHPHYAECQSVVDGTQGYMSFMTKSELLLWPRVRSWGRNRIVQLERHLQPLTTLLPDDATCEIWADIRHQSRVLGRPIGVADAWVAAAARQWSLPLVTANFKHFQHLDDLEIIPIPGK